MTWLTSLGTDHPVAFAVLILSLVAVTGLGLGNLRVGGIGLGIAGVLFSGIAFGHFGFAIDHTILDFTREFGLVLFVYTIGMQVGPGFFTSLRKQGLPLNLLAVATVVMGVGIALLVGRVMGFPIGATVGLFTGATTNTPALGAAQETLKSIPGVTATELTLPALAYAAAYPFGIMGIIGTMLLLRFVFKINPRAEAAQMQSKNKHLHRMSIHVNNRLVDGTRVGDLPSMNDLKIVVTRVRSAIDAKVRAATPDVELHQGDVLLAVGEEEPLEEFRDLIGTPTTENLMDAPGRLQYQDVVVTRKEVTGQTLDELELFQLYGVAASRITRAGVEMTAVPDLSLQYGDRVRIVGDPEKLKQAGAALGNSTKALQHTHFIPVFVGIALGVLLGSFPVQFGGMPAPITLGLAGGPLVVAILLSRIGKIGPLIWYMPVGANLALRELGIVLFLSCVGLKAGSRFVDILIHGDGMLWMGCAVLITLVPLVVVGLVSRLAFKHNYMDICGLLAGTMTDPPALAFANSIADSDAPSVAYATVYPLTMLLRILAAQLLVLMFH